jgi:hypothetical protein
MGDDLHDSVQRSTTKQVQAPEQTVVTQSTHVLEMPPETLLQSLQRTEVTAPVLTEETTEQNERLRGLVAERLERLRARHAAPVDVPDTQPDGYKARREREARREKARALTPGGDEYTLGLQTAVEREEKSRMLALPENVEHRPYYDKAHRLHLDERQLPSLCYTVELDKKGKPVSKEALEAVQQKNLQFWEDFTSGDQTRQKPHLDRIVDEILTFQFTPSMFEPENLAKNMEKYTRMSRLLTSLSDIRREFPWYFDALPAFKKEMLDDVDSMTDIFSPLLVNSVNAHGYNFENKEYLKTKREAKVYKEQAGLFQPMFQERVSAYAERREKTLRREAERQEAQAEEDRLLSVQVIGQGAYKYGLPSTEQGKVILREQSGLSEEMFSAVEETGVLDGVYEHMRLFNDLLSTIKAGDGKDVFMRLLSAHRGFIDTAAVLSQKLSKGTMPAMRALAGTIGFMAMKAMSYSGMIANLEAEFQYSVAMGDQRTLKTQVDDDEMGAIYEGRHMTAYKYQENVTDPEGTPLPVLSQNLRRAAGKDVADDKDFAAILMTVEAYENFLETAQIPPCVTEEDQAAYTERVEALSNQLLAFNDRITARAICYLDANAMYSQKERLCKALETSVLDRDTKENNFVRVAELSYRLRHNDFSNAKFNTDYTGVTLSEALRKTVVLRAGIDSKDVIQKGDAASVVYITKGTVSEQAVYRRGSSYRPWKRAGPRVFQDNDLDETKGSITGFETTKGRLIDSHKSSRDVAVRRVDGLFGANVIADASHVSLELDGTDGVLSTKMEKAVGVEAGKLKYTPDFRFNMYDGKPEPEVPGEDEYLNLAHPETMRQLYWLQVIDAISGSADRHVGNFFLKTGRNGALTKVTGIDNDMAFGEGFIPMKTESDQMNWASEHNNPYLMFTPVYEHAFPCVPRDIYEKVMALTPEKLSRELRGSVRDSELQTAALRLTALQEHLSHVPKLDIGTKKGARKCAEITQRKVRELSGKTIMHVTMNYFAMLSKVGV